MNNLDCVIIGYNDVDFGEYAYFQHQFANHSGTYSEVKTNSVLMDGRRATYMDLLNKIMHRKTGKKWDLNTFKMPSLGVAYLTSFLNRAGFEVGCINFFNSERTRLVEFLQRGAKSIAITTTYYVDDDPIKQIVKFARSIQPDIKIVVGGPRINSIHSSLDSRMQHLTYANIGADVYIVSSQGELTLSSVVRCIREGRWQALAQVPNLIYTDDRKTFKQTEIVGENNSLDANVVDWRIFDKDFFTPVTYMRTARSCPFCCEFCNYPAAAGAHTLASLEVIENEMRYLKETGLKYLIFIDDTFNVPLPRFKRLLQMMIKNRFDFRWVSFFRCSNADDEAFDLMEQSGCLGVYLGIESGDTQILNNMRKFANVKRYGESIAKLTDRSILTLASLIVGFPGETPETVQNTVEFLNAHPTTFFNVQLYFHDTLAPIEKRRAEYGIEGSAYTWSHNTMDWREAIKRKEQIIRGVKGPILLPLYGFSIWTVPYLLQHGFSVENINEFSSFANSLLLDELNGHERDIDGKIEAFAENFEIEGVLATPHV